MKKCQWTATQWLVCNVYTIDTALNFNIFNCIIDKNNVCYYSLPQSPSPPLSSMAPQHHSGSVTLFILRKLVIVDCLSIGKVEHLGGKSIASRSQSPRCFIFIKTRSTLITPINWMLTNIFEHQLFSKLLLNSLCIFRPSLHIFWTIRGRRKWGGHIYECKEYNPEKNQSVNRIKTKQFRWVTQKRFDLVLILLTLPVSSIAQRKHRILRTNQVFLEFLS